MRKKKKKKSKIDPAVVASNADREWFEAHPGISDYDRALIPGEFGQIQHLVDANMQDEKVHARVYVRQLGRGVRTRTAYFYYVGVPMQVRPFEDIPATVDAFRFLDRDEPCPNQIASRVWLKAQAAR